MCCCGVFVMPIELSETAPAQNMPRAARSRPTEFKGWHALALFVGFFAIIAAVNAVMLTVAIRTMPGLDARNGYDPSQRFNTEMKLAEQRAGRGWQADADVRLVAGEAALVVAIRTGTGATADGLQTVVILRHPSDRKRDRRIDLWELGDGSYSGKVTGVTPGAWDLVVEARPGAGGEIVFATHQRIILKG
jgi:nitrogen fixation protein FixH